MPLMPCTPKYASAVTFLQYSLWCCSVTHFPACLILVLRTVLTPLKVINKHVLLCNLP